MAITRRKQPKTALGESKGGAKAPFVMTGKYVEATA